LVDAALYGRILAPELLGQAWNKPLKTCLSRNVSELLQRANRVAFWVTTTILLQPRLRDRIRALQKFVGVARALRQLNNFNTLMGVVAALSTSALSRLKHTLAGLKPRQREQWEELAALMHPSNSFRPLRQAMEESGRRCLPYLGLFLSDLTFMEDGNPDLLDREGRSLLNFPKHMMIYKAIDSLLRYQHSADYKSLPKTEPLYTFLYELPALDENVLYALSLEREPRNASAKDLL